MNKKKHFYGHLVSLDSLFIALQNIEMSDEERKQLAAIIESHVHYTILDVVLSHLATEDKKIFLQHVQENNHDKIWGLLNDKTQDLEKKIIQSAEEVTMEFLKDIEKAKEKKR